MGSLCTLAIFEYYLTNIPKNKFITTKIINKSYKIK